MSNARYFADGVDFWRVIYDDDTTEGPYFNAAAAKRVGMAGTKKRKDSRGVIFQLKKSYRLQKLGIVRNECDGSLTACIPGLCFGGHGSRLDWEDWNA